MKRFREEKITVMADIQAMYHQVLAPDDQQTFLKFFWWSTDDIKDEPQVHFFQSLFYLSYYDKVNQIKQVVKSKNCR